ncbi:MAG: sigma-54-dependent Fis family transcriptional regulator [Saprospiraceae bacterium]|nr:sigma-54-dependent Fis family transcriptional regulator [Saprospiraceae bacterium]
MAKLQSIKQRFGIIGNSPGLNNALATAVRVSSTDLTVLISGESGVGKEVFSKIIHSLSPRKHNPFIAINCGAIPGGTINSELFGHEKGAFTGASSERKGYFETVNGGTIFLDEIAEMPLDTQSFLLRVLESGEFIRVGSSKIQKTDVRIVAASNVDLMKKVQKGKFREDLYYRLSTVPIKVPSLKERPEDILMLFRRFALDFAEKYRTTSIRLDEKASLIIENYSWPGNIRELKNVVEQLSVLTEEKDISAELLVKTLPHLLDRNLPAIQRNGADNFQEREILYKLLFDMKGDLNDLKSLVFEMIKVNDLRVPNTKALLPAATGGFEGHLRPASEPSAPETAVNEYFQGDTGPANSHSIIIRDEPSGFSKSEVVEENLSLRDMEKDMIEKALKKHRNRRKDAAAELGISERTLYRKIKEYEIQG